MTMRRWIEEAQQRVREMALRNAEKIALAEQEGRLRREVREETGYGVFPGGDPRRFEPDTEASTLEERERHKKACELASQGEGLNYPAGCQLFGDGSVWTGGGFGLGTYTIPIEFLIVTNPDGTTEEFF